MRHMKTLIWTSYIILYCTRDKYLLNNNTKITSLFTPYFQIHKNTTKQLQCLSTIQWLFTTQPIHDQLIHHLIHHQLIHPELIHHQLIHHQLIHHQLIHHQPIHGVWSHSSSHSCQSNSVFKNESHSCLFHLSQCHLSSVVSVIHQVSRTFGQIKLEW